MKQLIKLSIITLFLSSLFNVQAFEGRNPSEYNLGAGKLAILGFDPVAYFPEGGSAPAKGMKDISLDHEGVVYQFATVENLELFKTNPSKYEPAYGGWCSTAMAFGSKTIINPDSFVVNGNRLNLFSFVNGSDAKVIWVDGNTSRLERRADRNWKNFSGEEARK